MKIQRDQIKFGDTLIRYGIIRNGARDETRIVVRPDSSIIALAPKGTRATRVAKAVRGRADWILDQQRDFFRLEKALPRRFISGESYYYLGRQHKLKVLRVLRNGATPDIGLKQARFVAEIPKRWGETKGAQAVRDLLAAWYRQHARDRIEPAAQRVARKLGVGLGGVRMYELKSRWASCGKKGVLRFNWRIIMAPPSLVEYVVTHELCHLRHKDHSPAFWRLLQSIMPDYQERRERLTIMGPRYDI